jgi:hypothetical protein
MEPVTVSIAALILIGLAGVAVGLLLGFSLGRVTAKLPELTATWHGTWDETTAQADPDYVIAGTDAFTFRLLASVASLTGAHGLSNVPVAFSYSGSGSLSMPIARVETDAGGRAQLEVSAVKQGTANLKATVVIDGVSRTVSTRKFAVAV